MSHSGQTAQRYDVHSVAKDALAADIKKATRRLAKLKDLIDNHEEWLRKYNDEFAALTGRAQNMIRLHDSL